MCNRILSILALVLFFSTEVMAHGDSSTSNPNKIGLFPYLFVVLLIVLVMTVFIFILWKKQSYRGSLPIRKITVAGIGTILVNAIVFGFLFVEV